MGKRGRLPWVSKDYYQQVLTTVIDFQRIHSMKYILNNDNNNNNKILKRMPSKTSLLRNTSTEHIFVQLIGSHQEHILFTNGLLYQRLLHDIFTLQ